VTRRIGFEDPTRQKKKLESVKSKKKQEHRPEQDVLAGDLRSSGTVTRHDSVLKASLHLPLP
jgi:hypothetical protein